MLSVAMGIGLLVFALLSGISQHFTNWPGLAFLAVLGAGLLTAGLALSEAALHKAFMAAVLINVLAAVAALFK